MKKLLAMTLCLLLAAPAVASFVLSPNISYITNDVEETQPTPGNTSELGETRIDAKLGYILPMGLYVGGMYSSVSLKSGATSNSGSLIGPSIGYYSPMVFYTMLTYIIMGEQDLGPTTMTGAKGPQIDIGWVFPLSAYFAIGPQMTWRSVEFDKAETGGVSVDTDHTRTSIAPYLTLWFMF